MFGGGAALTRPPFHARLAVAKLAQQLGARASRDPACIVRGRLGRPARPVVHTSLHVDRRGPIDHMHRLIKFASLFTKNKVIDRISFVGMDVVRKHFDEGRSQPPRVHAACRLAPVCMRACDQEVSGRTCWHETVRCYRQVLRARRTCTCKPPPTVRRPTPHQHSAGVGTDTQVMLPGGHAVPLVARLQKTCLTATVAPRSRRSRNGCSRV